MKSDLTALGNCNVIIKYADDVDLLELEHSSVDLSCEFNRTGLHAKNKMIILIFRKPKNWFIIAQTQGTLFTPVLWKQLNRLKWQS